MGIKASLTTIKTIQNKDTIKKKVNVVAARKEREKTKGKNPRTKHNFKDARLNMGERKTSKSLE